MYNDQTGKETPANQSSSACLVFDLRSTRICRDSWILMVIMIVVDTIMRRKECQENLLALLFGHDSKSVSVWERWYKRIVVGDDKKVQQGIQQASRLLDY